MRQLILRYALLPGLLLLTVTSLRAQTFEEWFRQKKTQRKYLVQQIAALQAYAGVLREGYTIARQGISTVEQIKNGDLGLHQAFFGSLLLVSPAMDGSARTTAILRYQQAIDREFRQALSALRRSGQLQAGELAHLEAVKGRVLASCNRDLEALSLLLTANELQLRDAERLERLEAVYEHTLTTFRFTQDFLNEARGLALQRAREQQALRHTRSLYGLPE